MIIIGITGSIAMGKSYIVSVFQNLKIPVLDTDKVTAELVRSNEEVIRKIAEVFPKTMENGIINKKLLAKEVFSNNNSLDLLEDIIHPMVELEMIKFLKSMRKRKEKVVAIEVPMLYEANFQVYCDYVIVASAPKAIQMERLEKRKIDKEIYKFILQRQLKDVKKRKLADFVVNTGIGKAFSYKRIKNILKEILGNESKRDNIRY